MIWSNKSRQGATAGYSTVELAIAVMIMAMILLVAVPSITKRLPRYNLRRARAELFSELRAARRLAMTESRPVQVEVVSSNLTVVVRIDRDDDGSYDPDEETTLHFSKYDDLTMLPNGQYGVFEPKGTFTGFMGFWTIWLKVEGGGESYVYVFPSGLVEISSGQL